MGGTGVAPMLGWGQTRGLLSQRHSAIMAGRSDGGAVAFERQARMIQAGKWVTNHTLKHLV